MALDLTLLTTKAECDEALGSLAAELDGYATRTTNLGYADRQADCATVDISGQLAAVNAEIAGFTAMLAVPGLTPATRRATESKLRRATDRKDNLTERGGARTGAAAFLAAVDAEQVAAQVATLSSAQVAVTTHKATLAV